MGMSNAVGNPKPHALTCGRGARSVVTTSLPVCPSLPISTCTKVHVNNFKLRFDKHLSNLKFFLKHIHGFYKLLIT